MCTLVEHFVRETYSDLNTHSKSNYASLQSRFRHQIHSLEETIDADCENLSKVRKALKAMANSANAHCDNSAFFCKQLARLVDASSATSCDDVQSATLISASFTKFSHIYRQLSTLLQDLTKNLHDTLIHHLDTLLKDDIKSMKNELKRHYDRAGKDYDAKQMKIEKERQRQVRDSGEMVFSDSSEATERERRNLQLHMCEYLTKIHDVNAKKGTDLILSFIQYYNQQISYFRNGLHTLEQFDDFGRSLTASIGALRKDRDAQRRLLSDLRATLKQTCACLDTRLENHNSSSPVAYSLHRPLLDKSYGFTRKGYLMKKSEGKVRKVWQRRLGEVRDGSLHIWHSDETRPPKIFNLLTCQMRVCTDVERRAFDLISFNRTYHLQADDEIDRSAWIGVLVNCKEAALQKAFKEDRGKSGGEKGVSDSLRELQDSLVYLIQHIPGNDLCADCSSDNDVSWLSTNLGIVLCIECSGVHRDLGVHISRIQSLTLDRIGTGQLLLGRVMSNSGFNEIMEATLESSKKLHKNATMEQRSRFIRAKYIHRQFVLHSAADHYELLQDMELSVTTKHMHHLLQTFAEGATFSWVLSGSNRSGETALHLAIKQEVDGTSLHIVDFLAENTDNIDVAMTDGNTPLHMCAIYNRTECMKLLLRCGADHTLTNRSNQTPIDISRERSHHVCVDLLEKAVSGTTSAFENVAFDAHVCTPAATSLAYLASDGGGDVVGGSSAPSHVSLSGTDLSEEEGDEDGGEGGGVTCTRHGSQPTVSRGLCDRVETGESGRREEMALRRCQALYDCTADNDDELTFCEGEILVIVSETTVDEHWVEGYVEAQPERYGVFPLSFVFLLN